MFTKSTSLIIPSRNRPLNVERTLRQLKKLNLKFLEIIVIDSSDKDKKKILRNICQNYYVKLINSYPSTSHQRNLGLKNIKNNSNFIMFLDDDLIFLKNSFKEMDKFIDNNKENKIIGYGFNHSIKFKPNLIERIKNSKISSLMNLYSNKPGIVMRSGWHTKIVNLKKNTYVEWLPTSAVVYCSKFIKDKLFDKSLGQYSYLEDLDFSLNVKKKYYKFAIVSAARFIHPNNIARINFRFGYIEIVNRFKIVEKYKFSKLYFFYIATIKTIFSFLHIFSLNFNYLFKFFGNFLGLLNCLKNTLNKS
jgi:glycosyltransferase involved in cell wall biosynthesis